jgi:hypothetical protein
VVHCKQVEEKGVTKMATVRKLTQEEIDLMNSSKVNKRRENQFSDFFNDVMVGEVVEVELEDGDKVVTVRNKLKFAAKVRGFNLQFLRRKKNSSIVTAIVM